MSYDKSQFRDIVRTILHEIQLHSPEAEDIVVETCAQESQFGTYLKQLGGGPARGEWHKAKREGYRTVLARIEVMQR